MLASPLFPATHFREEQHDAAQYSPAKNVDEFNKLLPPSIEFVEGSSNGSFAHGDGKYQPINAASTTSATGHSKSEGKTKDAPSSPKPSQPSQTEKSLYNRKIEISFPPKAVMGVGLRNVGNTCFLNSALQILLHTPPLLRTLLAHTKSDPCRAKKGSFCMNCSMRHLMLQSYSKRTLVDPYEITTNLPFFAKHLRRGRQEDSHEFLRYAIDAMQKSCLAGYPPKLDPKLAETTWVHKIFGGQLRSRVTCLSCGHNSDTFDSILDLSVDIYGMRSLSEVLRKFVAVDHLKGADKYKCEKCKKHVNADKQFTLHQAPVTLCIHLKRFSPMGRKLNQTVRYDEKISLKPVMSEGSYGPTYSLYGVISHSGSGPNSGHYYAHIKNAHGEWYEMNDETVTKSSIPLNKDQAYILFYMRDKGQSRDNSPSSSVTTATSLAMPSPAPAPAPAPKKGSIIANMKKRKIVESDDEDETLSSLVSKAKEKKAAAFIGPRLPSTSSVSSSATLINRPSSPPSPKKQKLNPPAAAAAAADPQADVLKKKIAAASQHAPAPSSALRSLAQYTDGSSDDDLGEKVEPPSSASAPQKENQDVAAKAAQASPARAPSPAPVPALLPAAKITVNGFAPVPASSFYGTSSSPKMNKGRNNEKSRKRKASDDDDEDASSGNEEQLRAYARTPLRSPSVSSGYRTGNPFARLRGSNNLNDKRDNDGFPSSKRKKTRLIM